MKLLLSSHIKSSRRLLWINEMLKALGHEIYDLGELTNSGVQITDSEESKRTYQKFIIQKRKKMGEIDGILVLNFKNNGELDIEQILDMYEAFQQNKAIFVYNLINDINLRKELEKFWPIYINRDMTNIVDPFIKVYPVLTYLKENGIQLLENIPTNLGISKQQCDILLRKAQINNWIFVDRWDCFDTVELTEEGMRKINPNYEKKYELKSILVGGTQ